MKRQEQGVRLLDRFIQRFPYEIRKYMMRDNRRKRSGSQVCAREPYIIKDPELHSKQSIQKASSYECYIYA